MKPVILYRKGMDPQADEAELSAASKHFKVIHQRSEIESGDLVIGRYSTLPFYLELDKDVAKMGGKLICSFRQHRFVADMYEWVNTLDELTPKLYRDLDRLPEKGPFVLKGETNSKKHLWNTHMFARDRFEAGVVYSRLMDDTLISGQKVYARDYVPLNKLADGFNELPITEEYRFFVAYGEIVCGGFYWASHVDDLKKIPDSASVPASFLKKVISRVGSLSDFYVVDVARTKEGKWIVVELNCGSMSGLSCIDPEMFYSKLASIINAKLNS